jgi:hypothetical protein
MGSDLSYQCDVTQGFNFDKTNQSIVGHINSMKIGDTELDVDLAITDPTDLAGDKIKVVGVMSGIGWEGGFAQGIMISAQIGNANQKMVTLLQHADLSNTAVEFKFTTYAYDPDAKKYYKCFHANDEVLKGLVEKDSSGGLGLSIDSDQSTEVMSPLNFFFDIGIMPEDTEQEIHVAVSDTDKFVKNWGVTVKA